MVGSRIKYPIDREAQDFQGTVNAALRGATDGVPELFVGAPEVVDRLLKLVIEHACTDESAKPGLFTTPSANRESCQSRTKASPNCSGAPPSTTPQSSAPTFPGATDPRDYLDRC